MQPWGWGRENFLIPSAVYDVRSHPPSTAEGAATLSAGTGHLSLWRIHISDVLQKVTSACPVSSSPHEKEEGVERDNHRRVAEEEEWQRKH